MSKKMYEKFLEDFFKITPNKKKGFIKEGFLIGQNTKIPIKNYIPRFSENDYCESFSFQWNRYKNLQIDSKKKHSHSFNTIVRNTKWDLKKLKRKSILECGCGPGKYTEIFVKAGANVVAVDMSNAIDVNLENNGLKNNLLLIQGDIENLPFFYGKFDYVFCYGVLQHTPNTEKTFNVLVKYLKKGGQISIDHYRKLYIPTGWSTPKYFWRPITKRMDKENLLKILEWYIPKYIDIDTFIRRVPKIGIILTGLIPIPCWNYLNKGYTRDERIKHAIMDTFDALTPVYDKPKTIREIRKIFEKNGSLKNINVFSGSNGVVGNAMKIDS